MVDKLLAARGGEPDRQRQKQEDPEVVGAWFQLVGATVAAAYLRWPRKPPVAGI
ncbi:hypothetical protein K491DRAFT_724086 [Lophiostoma macrostomum CBS 122681]|uniref:Uncharacterized protein n=1 Tax=Lophiostoma macrostomum CBS 122681 TaxID=1314788 RepID=A0A6A6SKP7_9PLEO|nr:hypothetical protein K491DRAFT_724086 [Lophiostoma macrostomum CBS 122681]